MRLRLAPAALSLAAGLAAAALATATVAAAAPSPDAPRGVDTSRWQVSGSDTDTCGSGRPDWAKVAAKKTFVIHRAAVTLASSGATIADPCYAVNRAASARSGDYQGAYMYVQPSTKAGSAAAAARAFVAVTGRLQSPGDLPPVLDLEVSNGLSPKQLQAWASTWLTTVRALTGRQPMIYTGPSFWSSAMGDSAAFHAYPLWVAHWGATTPRVPGGWPTWTMWQYTSSGTVSGIHGSVDLDAFNGSAAQLAAFAHPASSFTTSTSGAVAYRGSHWTLSGHLHGGHDVDLAGRHVKLYRKGATAGATWTQVAETVTGPGGAFAFVRSPMSAASYLVRYSGGTQLAASWSAVRSHAIRDRWTTSLTEHLSHTTVAKGGTLHVTGSLRRPKTGGHVRGATVTLYQRVGSGAWTTVASTTTSAVHATYGFTVHPSRTAQLQVRFAGTVANKATSAPAQTVHVP